MLSILSDQDQFAILPFSGRYLHTFEQNSLFFKISPKLKKKKHYSVIKQKASYNFPGLTANETRPSCKMWS